MSGLPPSTRRLLWALGAAAVVAGALLYRSNASGPAGPPAGLEGVDTERARPGAAAGGAEPVPTLAAFDRAGAKGAVVRNVFRFYDKPTPVPTRVPPTPTPIFTPIGPRFPTATPTATPIVPPPIPYKVIAVFGPKNRLIVSFEDAGRLINAREGDVLDGRFLLRKIGFESVEFGFTNLPADITRRVPVPRPDGGR